MTDGILNLFKPRKITSQSAVNVVKRLFEAKKAGHCGTLDPMAQGVLPIMLGSAVKASEYLVEHDKTYVATLVLGIETDTQDTTGNIIQRFGGKLPEFEEIKAVAMSFLGEYLQIPPMVSALKVNGVKLLDLARKGKTVERQARTVKIHDIKIEAFRDDIILTVDCSKGTYIRTLCADIGKNLGCLGCMGDLIRTKTGKFSAQTAVTLEELRQMTLEERQKKLVPAEEALDMFPKAVLDDFNARLINNGCMVEVRKLRINYKTGTVLRLYNSGIFIGTGIITESDGIICLKKTKTF